MPDIDPDTVPAQPLAASDDESVPATDESSDVDELVPDGDNPPGVVGPSVSLADAAIRRMSAAPMTVSNPADVNLASGRGLTYEWEFVAAGLYDRVDVLEQAAPPVGAAFYFHNQVVASSSWMIPHNLGTAPDVLVLDVGGHQLLAEVYYPDTDTAVVVHGTPYAGSAYLRG